MPQNLVDSSSSFSGPVVAPLDGEGANAASLVQGLQPLANRTAYLNRLVANGDTSTLNGVASLRSASSTAAMAALTGVVNLGACFVSGAGLFFYLSASSATVDNIFVFNATGMGAGRWVHASQPVVAANYGLAQLDSSARVPAATVRNGMVGQGFVRLASNFTTTSTTLVDVTGSSFTIANCAVGDLVFVDFVASVTNAGSSNGLVAAAVVDGGTTTVRYESYQTTNGASGLIYLVGSGYHTVANAGSITVKLQTLTSNGANATTVSGNTGTGFPNTSVRALVIRP